MVSMRMRTNMNGLRVSERNGEIFIRNEDGEFCNESVKRLIYLIGQCGKTVDTNFVAYEVLLWINLHQIRSLPKCWKAKHIQI